MHPRLAELLAVLELEMLETNLFRGTHPPGTRGRLYGGQIMAQALIAAGNTVKQRAVHSLHGYFLRPGDASIPVVFKVEPIRDGASFSTRRVVAVQRGHAIFSMDASFQIAEKGVDHQSGMPDTAPPTRIPDVLMNDAFIAFRENYAEMKKMIPLPPRKRVWFRTNGSVPNDDPLLHAALLTYQSDDDLLSTARHPHRGSYDRSRMQSASLDHAMWFHRHARIDQWFLYDLDSPSAARARGFNRGTLFTADGVLVASTMQEGLMRFR